MKPSRAIRTAWGATSISAIVQDRTGLRRHDDGSQLMRDGQNGATRNKTEEDITAEVLARFSATPDPRLRQIMLSLIGHLHAFVKEVQLTEAEWFQAIAILTEAGKMS